MRYISVWEDGGKDNMKNFMEQNFERLPRFYKIMLFFQMGRARDSLKLFMTMLKQHDFKIEIQNLIQTFVILSYILHCTGCFWNFSSEGDIYRYMNWIRDGELEDAGMFQQYIASIYWATVTCTTVGYGDILPTNNYELLWAMLIIVFGVAVFSYILSDLSSKFSELTKNNQHTQDKISRI